METTVRCITIIASVLLFAYLSNGQTYPPPTIDSKGQMTPGQTFKAVCHHRYTPQARISVSHMNWICNIANELYDSYIVPIKPVPGSTDQIASATLTIANVTCSLDKIMCDCKLSILHANIPTSSNKLLQLNLNVPPESLQLSSPPPAIFVDQAFQMKCSGNVTSAARLLELYLEKNGVKSQLVTSDSSLQDNDTCLFAVSASTTYTLKRADRDSEVICRIRGSPIMKSTPLNLQYPVSDVHIKLNGFIPKGDRPQTVVEGSTYTIKCVADANPTPTYDFHYARTDNTEQEKILHDKPDYISRVAKKSHAGQYSCMAQNKLSTEGMKSKSFELKVDDKPTPESATSTGIIVAAVAGAAVLCMAIAGAAVYFRRRWSLAAETTYPAADYYYGGEYDEAYETPTAADAAPRGSVVASRGKDDAGAVVTVSISRSGSRIPDADSARSKSRDAGSRRSVRR